eukprot:scaffold10325_cov50-Cyclotella_meneghiniana.AAC.1
MPPKINKQSALGLPPLPLIFLATFKFVSIRPFTHPTHHPPPFNDPIYSAILFTRSQRSTNTLFTTWHQAPSRKITIETGPEINVKAYTIDEWKIVDVVMFVLITTNVLGHKKNVQRN